MENNPASHVDVPKTPRSLFKTVFKKKEVLEILKSPDKEDTLGVRDKAILELFYSTGIRNTEMRNLTILDMDLAGGLIKVKGKGGKERIIPVGEVAGWHIQEYMARSRPVLARGKETDVLFLSKSGKRLAEDFPAWMVRKYAKKAGITRYDNAHTFRHTFATHMIKKGANLRIVQEMLGHASLDTTQIYTKVEVTDLKRVHSKTHPREVDMV